jgi:hypothetical protein
MKTIEQVADIIVFEGLDYAVTEYLSYKDIEDKELAELWKKVNDALQDISDFMDEKLGEDWQWG